jgi:hypothetical protein
MSIFVERKLDTAFGPIEIAITRAEHISVQGQPVVRDTKFNCHLHFWLKDGQYVVRDEDRPNMTRAWVDGMKNSDYSKPAPPTYFAKVLAEYGTVLNAFMGSNRGLAVQAESEDIEREIGTAEGKVTEAREALRKAEEALEVLRQKRRKHQLAQVRENTFKVEPKCSQPNCAISYPHAQH